MTDRYREYNEITFEAYCKKAIDNAILKQRQRQGQRKQREIPLSVLEDNTLYALIPEDEILGKFDMIAHYISADGDHTIPIRSERLGKAISSLLPWEREIILRYYFLHQHDEEISNALKKSRPTVQRIRNQALNKLKRILEEST